MTVASVLTVLVTAASDMELRFRLTDRTAWGEFELRCAPWNLGEVLGEGAAVLGTHPGPVACDLAARVVDFTTKGGRIVRYAVPSLIRSG